MKEAVNTDKCHWEFTKTENVHELKTAKNKTKLYEQPKYSRVKWSMGN